MPLPGTYTACFHPNEMRDSVFEKLERFINDNRESFMNFGDLNLDNLSSLSCYDKLLRKMYFTMCYIRRLFR